MHQFTPEEVGITPEELKSLKIAAFCVDSARKGHSMGMFTIVDFKSSWLVFKNGVYLNTMTWEGHKGTPANVPCVPKETYLSNISEMKLLGITPTSENELRSAGLSLSVPQMLELMMLNGHRLELPSTVTFSPSAYKELKSALTKAGAKYSKSGFDFDTAEEASDALTRLLSGESINIRKSLQYFPTTEMAADILMDGLSLNGRTVFEPSAGEGYLVRRALEAGASKVLAAEIYGKFHSSLEQSGAKMIGTNVLELTSDDVSGVDAVLMNPPFSGGQDIKHVQHVLSIVPGHAEVHAIMSMSMKERTGKLFEEFRSYLESVNAEIQELPDGAFKDSGTMAKTCVVKIPSRENINQQAA